MVSRSSRPSASDSIPVTCIVLLLQAFIRAVSAVRGAAQINSLTARRLPEAFVGGVRLPKTSGLCRGAGLEQDLDYTRMPGKCSHVHWGFSLLSWIRYLDGLRP